MQSKISHFLKQINPNQPHPLKGTPPPHTKLLTNLYGWKYILGGIFADSNFFVFYWKDEVLLLNAVILINKIRKSRCLHIGLSDRFTIIMYKMQRIILIVLLVAITVSAPAQDKMTKVPGYPPSFNTSVYSGYLEVDGPSRALHYTFVQSIKGANNADPVTLWLNGGPGCSSLLGFLLQVGPYYLQDGVDYKIGDQLTYNEYSWHRASNLIFFESPAGVGYSFNSNSAFRYNDSITATDSLNALLDFFGKFPEYRKNKFFIAGESYAGKYIPDLAVLIDKYNAKQQAANRIGLVGILVGNGVMTFDTLEKSTIEFIIKKGMVDPIIVPFYQKYCQDNLMSDDCISNFLDKFDRDFNGVNPYDIYGYCYAEGESQAKKYHQSQQTILTKIKNGFARKRGEPQLKVQGPPCGYFDGVYNYFTLHAADYHSKGQVWKGPCAEDIIYNIDPSGSINSYQYLLNFSSTTRKYEIFLYNGNADAVVPYVDTYKGIEILKLLRSSESQPWFTNDQHSGFTEQFTGLSFTTFKGASHQVPQSKRAESFQYFKNIVTTFKNSKEQGQLRIQQQ